jgi:hypothetical protein
MNYVLINAVRDLERTALYGFFPRHFGLRVGRSAALLAGQKN